MVKMKIRLLIILFLIPLNSLGEKENDERIVIADLVNRKILDYCIVDTVKCDSTFRFFWDKKNRFFVLEHDKNRELLGVDFGCQLNIIDDRFFKKYNERNFDYFLPHYKDKSGNVKGMIEVEFPQQPKYFVRFLVRGYFFNFITYNIDDIYGEEYPFKDKNAFYVVYVPIWNSSKH